jgi:hypothetical protein
MPFEELLRYTIPGYVALTPFLFLYLLFSTSTSGEKVLTALIGILVLIGPAVGFTFHQIYMFMHERLLYANPKRRTLALIIRKFCEEEDEWKNKRILGSEALLAWDYTFHSHRETKKDSSNGGIDKDLRSHILRTWYFIHSLRGVALASVVGFFILLTGIAFRVLHWCTSNKPIFVCVCVVAVSYLMAAYFFWIKSCSTLQFLWPKEELTVLENWEGIKKRLVRILHAKGNITCYPSSRETA